MKRLLLAVLAIAAGCYGNSTTAPHWHCTVMRTDTLVTARGDTATVAVKVCK